MACISASNEEKTIAKVVLLAQMFVDRVVVCDDDSRDLTVEADIARVWWDAFFSVWCWC